MAASRDRGCHPIVQAALSARDFSGFTTGLAQLEEQRSPKPQVVGSSPTARAKFRVALRNGVVADCNSVAATQPGSIPGRPTNFLHTRAPAAVGRG